MHVLTVLDHPDLASFSRAIAERFNDGARAAGHTVELADLHQEGFNPLWSRPDIAQERDGPVPPDVLAEQDRIGRADAICLVFPLFWWGMPAMMKGWVDRVWSWGWAYDQLSDPEKSLQRNRTGILLIPAGAAPQGMAENGSDRAIETLWMGETFGYFGFAPRRLEILHGSTGSTARREGLLTRAWTVGNTLPPPATDAAP